MRAPLVLSILLLTACYDSRWGQTKAAQQHNAQASTPTAIHASAPDDDGPRVRATRFRVRVVANARHAAQTMDWQRQARDLVDDANRVLETSVGARLDIETMRAWSLTSDEDLDGALAALVKDEPAESSDWVVGLVGSLPRTTASFHDVGRAQVFGKHVVLRAAAPLGEHDAIEKSFDELGEDERMRLRKERKRHRAVAVFLHEIGHTLGAPHERDRTTLMNPFYDPKMAAYSPDAIDLMRISVDGRTRGQRDIDALEARLRAGKWSNEERDEALAQLEALRPPPAPAAAPPAPPPRDELAGLSDADRALYARAMELLNAGAPGPARELARPLFSKYPEVYAVQDLRCQLAVLYRLDAKALESECAPMKRLSSGR